MQHLQLILGNLFLDIIDEEGAKQCTKREYANILGHGALVVESALCIHQQKGSFLPLDGPNEWFAPEGDA